MATDLQPVSDYDRGASPQRSVAECMPDAVLESRRGREWHGIEVMRARIEEDGLDVNGSSSGEA